MSDRVVDENYDRARMIFALGDSVRYVLNFMNMKELYAAAQVCRSWCKEAMQIVRRRHLEVNPGKYENSKIKHLMQLPNVESQSQHGNVTLVFLNYSQQYSTDLLNIYEELFNSKVIVLRGKDSFMYKSLVENFYNPVLSNHLPVLFLQESEKACIRISFCLEYESTSNHKDTAKRMIEELLPKRDSKNIILLFTSVYSNNDVAHEIIRTARQRLESESYNIWGIRCSIHNLLIGSSSCTDDDNLCCVGLTISSYNIESWNYVVSCSSCYDCPKIKQDLIHFKNRIKLRKHNLGLLAGPYYARSFYIRDDNSALTPCYRHPYDFVNLVRLIFPEVSFHGLLADFEDTIYVNSNNYDDDTKPLHAWLDDFEMSLLIIAYD